MKLKDFRSISPWIWEIPADARPGMQAPVRLFASEEILRDALRDRTVEQAINAASLPGIAAPLLVMPDMHEGYGFPIGGVGITSFPQGIISPGGIGYDINCGVRLLASSIHAEEAANDLDRLATLINQHCPSGVGGKGAVTLTKTDLEKVCRDGARWAQKKGYAGESDLRRTEDGGALEGADPLKLSERARERGLPQLGSLGAGNHFIEVDRVETIFDADSARTMGLTEGCLAVQIHTGSRGLGHQVCTDFVRLMQASVQRYGYTLADRELVCAPLDSPEGQDYLAAMRAAANFAYANRQILAHQVRLAFEAVFAGSLRNWELVQVYDVTHNIGKIEEHEIEGKTRRVCVHRKGATRALAPGSPQLPPEYRRMGQPVLVPGSMGTSSWVLAAEPAAEALSFGSACHGAGRRMSRREAKKHQSGADLRRTLEGEGIHLRAGSLSGLAEEAPAAYKDVDGVIEAVCGAGIARRVAHLRPLVVIKG